MRTRSLLRYWATVIGCIAIMCVPLSHGAEQSDANKGRSRGLAGVLRNPAVSTIALFKSPAAMLDCLKVGSTEVSPETLKNACDPGVLAETPNGTVVDVLEVLPSAISKVQVADGPSKGTTGFVPSISVELPRPQNFVQSLRLVGEEKVDADSVAIWRSPEELLPCLEALQAEDRLARGRDEDAKPHEFARMLECAGSVFLHVPTGTRVHLAVLILGTPDHNIAKITVSEGAYTGRTGFTRAEWLRSDSAPSGRR